jgi:hypothetical protein
LEQICDEKSRPRGSGPSSQPAEESQPSGGLFSLKLSSWGKKFNSALESGMAKVGTLLQVCSLPCNSIFRLTNLFATLRLSKMTTQEVMLDQVLIVLLFHVPLLLLIVAVMRVWIAQLFNAQKKNKKASVWTKRKLFE